MCKIVGFTNSSKVPLSSKLFNLIRMSINSERDGFGYAALDSQGKLFGERWVKPNEFKMKGAFNKTKASQHHLSKLERNSFGQWSNNASSIIFHGRTSTNNVGINNTHPFVINDMALIHNGVVQDNSMYKFDLQSSCDSELILQHYVKYGIKSIEEHISGYYACMVLDANTGFLNVFKDSTASLYISYIRSIDTYMLATNPVIIEEVCKGMNWKYDQPESLLDNIFITFSGNEVLDKFEIKPKKDNRLNHLASKAFGRGFTRDYSVYNGISSVEDSYSENEFYDEQGNFLWSGSKGVK